MADAIEVDAPVSRVYHTLLEHLKLERDVKVERFSEPSLIEVKVGSWKSLRRGNPPGAVKLEMYQESEKTCVYFTFDFSTWLITLFIIAVIVNILCFAISTDLGASEFLVNVLVFVWIIPGDMRTQKKKFIDRVTGFLNVQKSGTEV